MHWNKEDDKKNQDYSRHGFEFWQRYIFLAMKQVKNWIKWPKRSNFKIQFPYNFKGKKMHQRDPILLFSLKNKLRWNVCVIEQFPGSKKKRENVLLNKEFGMQRIRSGSYAPKAYTQVMYHRKQKKTIFCNFLFPSATEIGCIRDLTTSHLFSGDFINCLFFNMERVSLDRCQYFYHFWMNMRDVE